MRDDLTRESSGVWFDRLYSITWYDESKGEYDPTNSLPQDQILYGDAPKIVQREYLDGKNGGINTQHKSSLGVLELTPN